MPKIPDFQERLVMHLEGDLQAEPYHQFYRLEPGKGPQSLKDPKHLYLMMAAQEEEGYRPKDPSPEPELMRRVLGGRTQLNLLINGGQGTLEVQKSLMAVIQSVRRAKGWTLAYGGHRIEGASAHVFFKLPNKRRYYAPHSNLKIGIESSFDLENKEALSQQVGEIRRLVMHAASSRCFPLVLERLNKAFGKQDDQVQPGSSLELSGYWLKRYVMGVEAGPKHPLLQHFLENSGVPVERLHGTELGRFFEENM